MLDQSQSITRSLLGVGGDQPDYDDDQDRAEDGEARPAVAPEGTAEVGWFTYGPPTD
ncbi:hypothetical protein [Flexivirga alba]|uniref:Uncharacterized protein n=1 Tax=Flexivirga alba TaxID=702742 RepID=A0ABW2AF99_9MICO